MTPFEVNSSIRTADSAMFSCHGQGVVRGYAIGRAELLGATQIEVSQYAISAEQVEAQQQRLRDALLEAEQEISALVAQLPTDAPKELAALLGVHSLLLQDPNLRAQTERYIAEHLCNAEWALHQQGQLLQAQFSAMQDDYLRERGSDIRQVVERVLALLKQSDHSPAQVVRVASPASASRSYESKILVARDIAPADMLALRHRHFGAFLTDLGGPTSHTAIVARSMGVPAIVGMGGMRTLIHEHDLLIVDGFTGEVIINPSELVLAEYQQKQKEYLSARAKLESIRDAPAITLDGVEIQLLANIELPEEASEAYAIGANGIGLFRSEFLFMGRKSLPSEDEQFEAYRYALEAMHGLPVTIRTLDIGADKMLEGEQTLATNPALGLRAVRYCLAHPELFQTQLRALLRASVYGQLQILIPMLSTLEEVIAVKQAIVAAQHSLKQQRIDYVADIKLGGMVEVPAAAIAIEPFAVNLEFLSLGTNDLIQYVMAVDRGDAQVADLYDPMHPAVLRLISHVINAGERFTIPVSVCGEMAGDSSLTRLLLGLGLTKFSMHPAQILDVKREILMSHSYALRTKLASVLNRGERVDSALLH